MLVGAHHYSWYCCCTRIHHPMSIDGRKLPIHFRQTHSLAGALGCDDETTKFVSEVCQTYRQTATNTTLAEVMEI